MYCTKSGGGKKILLFLMVAISVFAGMLYSQEEQKALVLQEMTWTDVRDYLTQNDMVIIPLGSTEQHGPHMPLGTDFYEATGMAKQISARTGVLVAPVVMAGYSVYHSGFPGSLSLKSETLEQVLFETAEMLIKYGFHRIMFFNYHGGNRLAEQNVIHRINHSTEAVAVAIGTGAYIQRGGEEGDFFDSHAGVNETSMMLYFRPDLVKMDRVERPEIKFSAKTQELLSLSRQYPELSQVFASVLAVPEETGKGGASHEISSNGIWSYSDVKKSNAERGKKAVERMIENAVKFIEAWKKATPALSMEAREIHDRVLTVDTHSDTPMLMVENGFDIGARQEAQSGFSMKIDLPRMKEGGMDAVFFAAYVSQGERTPEGYATAKKKADAAIDAVYKMCENYPELIELALLPSDAYRLEKQGKSAAFIGIENGYPVGNDLSLVEEFYKRGVRYITLCHSGDNDICDSSTERKDPEDRGLSEFGNQVVAECNRLGIMIDVSHVSDQSFFDIIEHSQTPVIASHSAVRPLCDHPRNFSDEMLEALRQNGGVIQICLVSGFLKKDKSNPERDKAIAQLREKYGSYDKIKDNQTRQKVRQEYTKIFQKYPGPQATIQDLANHIDYAVKLIGVDHVGIGSDFDGGGGIKGCNDVSEMPNITVELLRRGYSEEDVRKIWGGNIMRVFQEVIDASKSLNSQ